MAHDADMCVGCFGAVHLASVLAFIILLTGCPMHDKPTASELPRFTKLERFNPHRPTFACKHEADTVPPITPEAETVFQQALVLDSYEIWHEQRDYKKIAELYQRAMTLGHWKAQFNLAGLYLKGAGVPQDVEKAVALTEDLMRKGVPAAWDNMGAYHMGGVGPLKQDASVGYAFWQKAADMGSKASQTYIGAKLLGDHDEPPSFWGNRAVGLKMLECAFAQGEGRAAYELGITLEVGDEDTARALKVLHAGVMMGSEGSASALDSSFRHGDSLVGRATDPARAARYAVLAGALYTNPDLRFPNLDKVLPLPPAPLPKWDSNKQTLIDAAKAVVPVLPVAPTSASSPAAQRTGRAHIPEGYVLPDKAQEIVPAQYETTKAPIGGYWRAQLQQPSSARHADWDAAQMPMRYAQGELFDRTRPGLTDTDGRILFHYLGEPVSQPVAVTVNNPLVARGIAREVTAPEPALKCPGHRRCPATGIWHASVAEDHPMAAVFNQWNRQSYVVEGHTFPDPREAHLDIRPAQVTWQWLSDANEVRAGGIVHITVG